MASIIVTIICEQKAHSFQFIKMQTYRFIMSWFVSNMSRPVSHGHCTQVWFQSLLSSACISKFIFTDVFLSIGITHDRVNSVLNEQQNHVTFISDQCHYFVFIFNNVYSHKSGPVSRDVLYNFVPSNILKSGAEFAYNLFPFSFVCISNHRKKRNVRCLNYKTHYQMVRLTLISSSQITTR